METLELLFDKSHIFVLVILFPWRHGGGEIPPFVTKKSNKNKGAEKEKIIFIVVLNFSYCPKPGRELSLKIPTVVPMNQQRPLMWKASAT